MYSLTLYFICPHTKVKKDEKCQCFFRRTPFIKNKSRMIYSIFYISLMFIKLFFAEACDTDGYKNL